MKFIVAIVFASAWLPLAGWSNEAVPMKEPADFVATPASRSLFKQLREGGYVLYMLNANTDTSQPDHLPKIDLNDCNTQRPLTQEGLQAAAWIGRQIRRAKIPINDIIASPLCRTTQTAEATFGKNYTINNTLMYTASMTRQEKIRVAETTRELLSKPVAAHTNRVLVAHAQNLMDLIRYLPKPEGIIVIFQPLGNGQFNYIASLAPDQWRTLQSQSPGIKIEK